LCFTIFCPTGVAFRFLASKRSARGRVMPIRRFLDGQKFDPEIQRLMGLAFEMARAALHVEAQCPPADEIIARQIIELAKTGEHDPDRLCECALAKLREADPNALHQPFTPPGARPVKPG
jgi:hypothetical protein